MSPLSWRQYYWSLMIARALLTYLIFIDVAYNAKLLNFSTIDAAFGKSHHHQENQQASPPSPSNNSRRSLRSVYLALNDNNNNNNYSNNNSNSNRNINSNSNENNNLYLSDQPAVLDQCCACDEAKYELVFEGLWSRYTHPEDFPENYWLAHFSDIIGASHSNEFRMWNHNTLATEGVRELAETGSTKKLESELKQVSSKTRTIIKARELRYPLLNGKTSAVFRTDRQHHLVSILSKLNPSPDWILGVSGLELCQLDCSWASQRVVNLYLWDAGTDSGTTFTAPDTPTRPQEPIHPYRKESSKSNSSTTAAAVPSVGSTMDGDQTIADSPPPIDQTGRSYLADSFVVNPAPASGGEMEQHSSSLATTSSKPYARLTITRQRIYEKSCNTNGEPATRKSAHSPSSSSSSSLSNVNPIEWAETTATSVTDCRYTDWSDWSSCSSNCGRGIRTRTRSFVDEQAHLAGCSQTNLIEKEICLSECIGGNLTCVTRDWSEWSRCSVTCGQGIRKRTRSPIGPMRKACGRIELSQTEACSASHNVDCSSAPADTNGCEVSEWSQWSRCSVACGKGTRIRTRQYLQKQTAGTDCNATLIQKSSCTGRLETCQDSKANGAHGKTAITTAVPHNPNLPVIDCKLSSWSPWSTCSALCGEARRTRSRYIVQMPQNGGKACDKKLSRTQKCRDLPPCPPNYPIAETTAPVASRPTN